MARPLRIEYAGAVYHVTSRGNAGQTIFLDDGDREAFLATLSQVVARFGWLCHAYCLMGNHYHLLLETPEANLSEGMRQLNATFTQRLNRRHGRAGHVLQGRFKAILVDRDAYLLELARYVVLNPVRARMVRSARDWKWTSYRATAGQIAAPSFLTTDWILSQFGTDGRSAQMAYRRFVAEGIGSTVWENVHGVLLGKDSFVEKMRPLLTEKADATDTPLRERLSARPHLATLFEGLETGEKKAERAFEAFTAHRYTLKEIGAELGVHYSTVSKMIHREQLRRGTLHGKL